MKSEELLKQVQEVERKYQSVLDAPDEVMKPIIKISNHLEDKSRSTVGKNASSRSEAITEAIERIDTSTMTADEITDYLNQDIDVTNDGALVMDKHSVYSLLNHRKIPYKRKSRREYNPQIIRGKKNEDE